ncbi:MAG: hypothetical protein H0V07_12035 [Propionibacteriales bacterium]|nr:hypothetical protein [Propionibacteriales bacterium]
MDDESHWQKQLLIGLVMLLVVGALIGGIVAVASIKAADLAGIGDTTSGTRSRDDRLHVPRNADTPTTAPSGTVTPETGSAPTTSATTSPPTRNKRPRRALTLTISPATASTYERITLSGRYQAPEGTSLQVQRMEGGGWVDFPTTASVSAGTYSTYIETGHTGVNRFRVTDTASGRSSDVATVTVQ